ncbi:hypothetical protein ACIBJF_39785 [Streptomyces sp. NPDC050743]|uniref:hypothetical protein n=1 Tax=Streptomyces sp. NPDC050743 TaxID=3365634 RepID=UPI0037922733
MTMAAVPVKLRCTCGHDGAWLVMPGQSWICPACARTWVPDAASVHAVAEGARDLARLRRLVLGLAVGALTVAAVLVAIHPAWILGVPTLVGGVLLASRPTYRKRREQALASTRTSIPLTESRAV